MRQVNTMALIRQARLYLRLESDPARQAWLEGYLRGLHRRAYGEQYGTPAEHERWMALADDPHDAARAARGRGYRAGLIGAAPEPPEEGGCA